MTLVGWLWIGFAAAFALAGLIVLLRALFADRSRGRKRCPECWYDMTGATSLRCTECGREAKSERRLCRTHRHWRVALLGILLIVTGLGLYAGGEVHRDGWIRATPTVGYIVALPWLDQNTTLPELTRRVNNGELRQWEYRLLVNRALRMLRSSEESTDLLRALGVLLDIETNGARRMETEPWKSWARIAKLANSSALETLLPMCGHPDPQISAGALKCLEPFIGAEYRRFWILIPFLNQDDLGRVTNVATAMARAGNDGRFPQAIVPQMFISTAYRTRMPVHNDEEWRAFCAAVGACGLDEVQATQVFLNSLDSPNPVVRTYAAWGASALAGDDPEVQNRIFKYSGDADPSVRAAVLSATITMPLDELVRSFLAKSLVEGTETREAALHAIRLRGKEANSFLDAVRECFREQSEYGIREAIDCFLAIGGDPDELVEILVRRLQAPRYERSQNMTLDHLSRLGLHSRTASVAIEPFLQSEDPEIQSAAANAYSAMGGSNMWLPTWAIWNAIQVAKRNGSARSQGPVVNRWLSFARRGRFSQPRIEWMLEQDEPAHRVWGAYFVGNTGSAGVFALPRLREMLVESTPQDRPWFEDAIRRLEWASEHPEWKLPE